MEKELKSSVCHFCNAEIKLTADEWGIQTPHGTLPVAVCRKCATDTVSLEHRKRGYMMFISRKSVKPDAQHDAGGRRGANDD